MPLRLHVGLEQNVELPDASSLRALCYVELELNSHLIDRDPKSFQREVEQAFDACRNAVKAEVARQQQPARGESHDSDSPNCPAVFRINGQAKPSPIRVLRTIS